MPILNSCWRCNISLRTGAVFVGLLDLLLVIYVIYITLANSKIMNEISTDGYQQERVGSLLVLYAMGILIIVLFLFGVILRKTWLMLPYIVSSIILLLLFFVYTVYYFKSYPLPSTIEKLAGVGVKCYLSLVVISCYQKVKQENGRSLQQPPSYVTAAYLAQPNNWDYSNGQVMVTTQKIAGDGNC